MDLFDWLVIIGVLLMGLAVWLVASWPGLVGYGGGLLVVVGIVGAWLRKRSKAAS
jgi:hypothetical protein